MAGPVPLPRAGGRDEAVAQGRVGVHQRVAGIRLADRAGAVPLFVEGGRAGQPAAGPAAHHPGGGARVLAAVAVPAVQCADRVLDHRDRAHHVLGELRGAHREGTDPRLRLDPGGGGDGPRRAASQDGDEGDPAAHPPRHRRGRHALVRALARRLHHHAVQRGQQGDLPALRIRRPPRRLPAADQRARHHHPRREPAAPRREGAVASPHPPAPAGGPTPTAAGSGGPRRRQCLRAPARLSPAAAAASAAR